MKRAHRRKPISFRRSTMIEEVCTEILEDFAPSDQLLAFFPGVVRRIPKALEATTCCSKSRGSFSFGTTERRVPSLKPTQK